MVTNRQSKTMFNRIFALVAVLTVAVLAVVAGFFAFGQSAHAEEAEQNEIVPYADVTHDDLCGANHSKAKPFSLSDDDILYRDTVDYYLKEGTYYLTEDVTVPKPLAMSPSVFSLDSMTVTICLNGHSIYVDGNCAFRVYGKGSVLNICDCVGTATMDSSDGIYVFGGTLNMYGGTAKGATGYGSGLSVSGGGTFNMYGGAIKDNHVSGGGGGGVFIGHPGTFNMYGGEITGNSTSHYEGGAGVYIYSVESVFHMYGGSITNNVLDCAKANNDAETLSLFYKGAGVGFSAGEFSIEGDVNISGNVRQNGSNREINNVELKNDSKIDITGKLGNNARIGITAPVGTFTKNYSLKGNTKDPSEFFISDNGATIGFDTLRKEAAVTTGEDTGSYDMTDARVIGAATAKVGDTSVTLTIEVTLKNSKTGSTKTIEDVVTISVPALHGGKNPVSFTYKYNGASGEQTKPLSYDVVPEKMRVTVTWSCSGPGTIASGQNEYRRNYDGNDIIDSIKAKYTDGAGVEQSISASSDDMVVLDGDGQTVTSVTAVGVYSIYLKPSDEYDFEYNMFTLTVVGSVDDGYYTMKDASVVGKATATVGSKTFSVTVKVTLEHTKDQPNKTQNISYTVTADEPLKLGTTTVNFEYKYTDAKGGVQTKNLSVEVEVVKKSVTIKWYFFDKLISSNATTHVYDNDDVSSKIVAEYDGIDGTKQRVAGNSASMIKKDANGNTVTSLKSPGVYKLSLADSENYEFSNNLFTYTVAESLSEIADLTYSEAGVVMLGVTREEGFASDMKVTVESAQNVNQSNIDGEISAAYNIKFSDSNGEINSGVVTVHMRVPEELNGMAYKVYNLNNGVVTEMDYTKDGNFVVFDVDDVVCILFVKSSYQPPVVDDDPNTDNNVGTDPGVALDDGGLTWLWIILVILGVCIVIVAVVLIVKSKRDKVAATGGDAPKQETKPAQEEKPVQEEKTVQEPKSEQQDQEKPEQKYAEICPSCYQPNYENSPYCTRCGKRLD